jgi:simple sugar transport system permease protein
VLGAMAGQIGLIAVVNHDIHGMSGIAVAVLIALPIALAAGILVGYIFNKARGREMITGIVLGFVANGVYQFIFLFIAGTSLMPFSNREMIRPVEPPVGLRNTVDLAPVKSALDNVLKVSVLSTPVMDVKKNEKKVVREVSIRMDYVKAEIATIGPSDSLGYLEVPVVTFLVIAVFCGCVSFISRTKLGQDFRAIGQDSHVAEVAGIKANRTRIVAVCISIVLAAMGQIIALQEFGTMNTYSSHEQVGMYAVAALVIGGGTFRRAKVRHVIVGVLLFHLLLVVSWWALRNIIGSSDIAEYFRAFVVYGIVAISLVVHAWQRGERTANRD